MCHRSPRLPRVRGTCAGNKIPSPTSLSWSTPARAHTFPQQGTPDGDSSPNLNTGSRHRSVRRSVCDGFGGDAAAASPRAPKPIQPPRHDEPARFIPLIHDRAPHMREHRVFDGRGKGHPRGPHHGRAQDVGAARAQLPLPEPAPVRQFDGRRVQHLLGARHCAQLPPAVQQSQQQRQMVMPAAPRWWVWVWVRI